METLSRKDCEEILKEVYPGEEVQVTGYEEKEIGSETDGLLSERKEVKVLGRVNSRDVSVVCFVKTMPKNPFHLQYIKNIGAFVKEPLFYKKLGKEINKFAVNKALPDCYLARVNKVLVIEKLEGYSCADTEYFTLEQMKAAVKALAELHSASLTFESKYNVRLDLICEDFIFETLYVRKEGHMGLKHMRTGARAFMALVDKRQDIKDDIKEEIYQCFESLPETVQPSIKYRNVLTHGDLYSKNVMFSVNEPITAKIVDFQLLRYNPPAMDLLTLIYLNSEPSFRETYFASMIDLYYESVKFNLECYGLDASIELPKDEFLASTTASIKGAITIKSLYELYVNHPKEHLAKIMADEILLKKYLQEDRTAVVMDAFKTCTSYRSRMNNSIEELISVCKTNLK